MQGCDMACLYCHNPETRGRCDSCGECIATCPEGALTRGPHGTILWDEAACSSCDTCLATCGKDASPRARRIEARALQARLASLEPFIDGITFSGGECGLQAPFLLEVAPLVRALRPGLTVLADTNGATEAGAFASLLGGLDGFIFDLKAWDPQVHKDLTGLGLEPVRANLATAALAGKLMEVRTVLVEGLNDDRESILASAKWLASLPGNFPWRLIPFRPQGVRGSFASRGTYPKEALTKALGLAQSILGPRALGPAVAL